MANSGKHRDSPLWAPAWVTFVKLMITFNISKFALIRDGSLITCGEGVEDILI